MKFPTLKSNFHQRPSQLRRFNKQDCLAKHFDSKANFQTKTENLEMKLSIHSPIIQIS